jgi:hydrogenase expression/formation protein HypC
MCLAVPGRITEIYVRDGLQMARVDFSGALREACLQYVPEAEIGQYVIVHAGFAISLLGEAEAQATLDLLRSMAGSADADADGGPP